jgi:hypothetical protein
MLATKTRPPATFPFSVTYYDIAATRTRTRRFTTREKANAFALGLRTNATSIGPVVTRK